MPDKIIITKIELQNPRKKTYSLYQEDTFLIEITEDTLVHFAISRDNVYSKKVLNNIIEHDKVTRCLTQAYRYLRRRPHLKIELQRKLKNKNYNPAIIDKAFIQLQKNNYINDNEYIRMFIRDSIRQGKSGPLLIKKKLAEKGAVFNKIDQHLDVLYSSDEQLEKAFKLLRGKYEKITNETKIIQKQKLQKYGMSRGFSWNILEPVIYELIGE